MNNIGWVYFCRTAQDKAACFALLVPIGIVLGLRLLRVERESNPNLRSLFLIYLLVVSSASLIHPLGAAWCALGIVPFALIEFTGRRVSTKRLVLIIIPFIASSLIVLSGRGSTVASLKVEQYRSQLAWDEWVREQPDTYMPGSDFPPNLRSLPKIVRLGRTLWISNPSYITRFPLAIAGFVLSWILLAFWRSRCARFLFVLSAVVVLGSFTPPGTTLLAQIVTAKMVIRLTWLLPWGFIIAFFVLRMNLRPLLNYLLVLVIALGLGRFNPVNYLKNAYHLHHRGRPSAPEVEIFHDLASEPSPQGFVLGPIEVMRKVAAFVPDAYPAAYRGLGTLSYSGAREILEAKMVTQRLEQRLRRAKIKYLILDHEMPLAGAVATHSTGFKLVARNQDYAVWKVCDLEGACHGAIRAGSG